MSADRSDLSSPATPLGRLGGLLGSPRFALGVVVLLAMACVAGTLIPQGAQVEEFLKHNPAAQGRLELLNALGLTHVFFSVWFVGLLGALAASLVACTFRRYNVLRQVTGAKRLRVLGALITHISLLLVLVGGVIRAGWGEKGYIDFAEGETVSRFVGQRGPVELPFALRLVDFSLERYDEGGAPRSMGAVKAYKSRVEILSGDRVVREASILVNLPLTYGGYTFYQYGYDAQDLARTTLQVVRDPGVFIVYAGFVLIMVGLTIVFWVAPTAESSERKREGAA
jgi:cytochrome c biogenesis protein ResB